LTRNNRAYLRLWVPLFGNNLTPFRTKQTEAVRQAATATLQAEDDYIKAYWVEQLGLALIQLSPIAAQCMADDL
jgi:hypothetical protein